jgi:hypothetical protein
MNSWEAPPISTTSRRGPFSASLRRSAAFSAAVRASPARAAASLAPFFWKISVVVLGVSTRSPAVGVFGEVRGGSYCPFSSRKYRRGICQPPLMFGSAAFFRTNHRGDGQNSIKEARKPAPLGAPAAHELHQAERPEGVHATLDSPTRATDHGRDGLHLGLLQEVVTGDRIITFGR